MYAFSPILYHSTVKNLVLFKNALQYYFRDTPTCNLSLTKHVQFA